MQNFAQYIPKYPGTWLSKLPQELRYELLWYRYGRYPVKVEEFCDSRLNTFQAICLTTQLYHYYCFGESTNLDFIRDIFASRNIEFVFFRRVKAHYDPISNILTYGNNRIQVSMTFLQAVMYIQELVKQEPRKISRMFE